MFSALVDDLVELQGGFMYRGEKWHLVTVGMKGDLPQLIKTGGFIRHWLRAERKQKDPSKDKPDQKPAGVCHLCSAGTEDGGPFEDCNWNARWAEVVSPLPWARTPSLLRLLHQASCPERMFRSDIWHNFHGGCGKLFFASAITECMQRGLVKGSSRVAKIAEVDSLLKRWARQPGHSMPHSGGFCVERIGLTSWAVQPDGSWSKHDDTRVYLEFLEDWLRSRLEGVLADEVLTWIFWATAAINRFFKLLYSHGLWMTRQEARTAGVLGRKWLRCYVLLAKRSWEDQKLRFPLVVKHHLLDHSFRDLILMSERAPWTWNPLADSVQLDEDFIGHCARLGRRVSPISQAQRVLERYRAKSMEVWKQG